MSNDKAARNSLITAVVLLVIVTTVFAIYYTRTKNNIENFNDALGKKENVNFSMVLNTILNDNKLGTTEENVIYAKKSEAKKGVIDIKEKMFVTQVSDVYVNPDDYLGKTIKLEGMFKKEQPDKQDPACYYVCRLGPGGCCGADASVGFEVKWSDGKQNPYPDNNAWAEAIGTLKKYKEDNNDYLYLDLSSLKVLTTRGAEYVQQ